MRTRRTELEIIGQADTPRPKRSPLPSHQSKETSGCVFTGNHKPIPPLPKKKSSNSRARLISVASAAAGATAGNQCIGLLPRVERTDAHHLGSRDSASFVYIPPSGNEFLILRCPSLGITYFFFPIYLAVELPPPFFDVSQAKWKRGGRYKEKKEEKIFKRKKKHLTSVHILTAQNLISHRKPSCRPVISSHHGKRKRYGQYEQKEK